MAFKRELEEVLPARDVQRIARRLAPIVERQTNSDTCIQNCLNSVAVAQACLTVDCICSSTSFRDASLQCLNSSCGNGQIDYTSALDTVLKSCQTGGLSGIASVSASYASILSGLTGSHTVTTPHPSGSSKGSNGGGSGGGGNGGGGGGKTNVGAIAGGVAGGVVLIALFVGLIFFLVRRSRRRAQTQLPPRPMSFAGPPAGPTGKQDPAVGAQAAYNLGANGAGGGRPPSGYAPSSAPSNGTYAPNGPYSHAYPNGPPNAFAGAYAPTTTTTSSGGNTNAYTPSSPISTSGLYSSYAPSSTPGVAPNNELGYVPPQQFTLYTTNPSVPPAAGAGAGGDHFDPYAAQWPGDIKRPLNVMSADSGGATSGSGSSSAPAHAPAPVPTHAPPIPVGTTRPAEDEEDAPPVYRQ